MWSLVGALLVFGACSVFGFAASQSLLPTLVPVTGLVRANARLDQTEAAAQTFGPALGGGLVAALGAPLALLVDAVSYLAEAVLVRTVGAEERHPATGRPHLIAEIREGLRWTYRHRVLGPLALSTHVWFQANGVALTALSLFALRSLGFGAGLFGALLATSGVASLAGAALAPWLGTRLGTRRTVLATRACYPFGWTLTLVAAGLPGAAAPALFAGLALLGLAAGAENPNEMGLWQSLTPDDLLGRVNGTRRSLNRTMAALGALGAGFLIGQAGEVATFGLAIAGFAVAALVLVLIRRDEAATPAR